MPIAANLYYQTYQKGDLLPVVLIHGAGGTHLYWPSEVRRLRGYHIYALDLPGHGKSKGHGFQSISAYSRKVSEWMGAIGLHRAVFVGHSMGGAIAMTLALDYPEQVLGLGLVGSSPKLPVNSAFLENADSPSTFHNAVEMLVNWSFSPESPEQLRELATKRMAETRPSVLHGDLLACDTFDIGNRLGEIHQPALVICGSEDKMTPLRYSLVLKDNLPSARLETIPAAGHMVMLERPLEVAQTLVDFLAKIKY
jgi:pimeloyl-ACP methyl ester carboxylesterase